MRPRSVLRSRWFWCPVLALGLLVGMAMGLAGPGLRFVSNLAHPDTAGSFRIEERSVQAGDHRVPLRLYWPKGPVDRVLLLAHGVHYTGYDEPRLVRCAREMARVGYLVATPDLQDLKRYDLTTQTLDELEASARYLLEDATLSGLAPRRRLALCGISFSGGLCLSVASRPSLRGRLGCVFSLGGHGDLERVMRYLATGELPDGRQLPPHLYGQAVVLCHLADQLVPGEQVGPLRASLQLYLRERGQDFTASLSTLPPEAKRIAELCLHWDAQGIGEILRPLADRIHCDPSLSPALGPVPDCEVFLLHGSQDNVIPPSETEALAHWASASTRAHALVTDLVRHVELESGESSRFRPIETYRLGRFMTRLLRS